MLLRDKVSEERVGTELDKMLEGNNPHLAVMDLHKFGILPLLYKFPRDLISEVQEVTHFEQSVKTCFNMHKVFTDSELGG